MELRMITVVIFTVTMIPLFCKAQYRALYNAQYGRLFGGLGFEALRRQSQAEPVPQPTFNTFAFARQNRQNSQEYQPQSLSANRGNFRLSHIDGVNFIGRNRQSVQEQTQSPSNGQAFGWQNRQAYRQYQPQSQRHFSRNPRRSHLSLFNDLVFGGENRESNQRALQNRITNKNRGSFVSNKWNAFEDGVENRRNVIDNLVENRIEQTENIHGDQAADILQDNWDSAKDQAENNVNKIDNIIGSSNNINDRYDNDRDYVDLWGNNAHSSGWNSFILNKGDSFEDVADNRLDAIDNRVENRIEQTENIHGNQAADILEDSWDSVKDGVENNVDKVEDISESDNNVNNRYDNDRDFVDLWGTNAQSSGWNSFISNRGDSFEDVADNRLDAIDNRVENRIEQTENIHGNQAADILEDSWDSVKDGVENNVDTVEDIIESDSNVNNRYDNDRDFVDLWGINAQSSGWNSFISNRGDSFEDVAENRLDAIDNRVENRIEQIENTNDQETADILENGWDSTKDRIENNVDIVEDIIERDNNINNRFDNDRTFLDLMGTNAQSSVWNSFILNRGDSFEDVAENRLDAIDNRVENRIEQVEDTNSQQTDDILENSWDAAKNRIENRVNNVEDNIEDTNINNWYGNNRGFFNLWGNNAQHGRWNGWNSYEDADDDW